MPRTTVIPIYKEKTKTGDRPAFLVPVTRSAGFDFEDAFKQMLEEHCGAFRNDLYLAAICSYQSIECEKFLLLSFKKCEAFMEAVKKRYRGDKRKYQTVSKDSSKFKRQKVIITAEHYQAIKIYVMKVFRNILIILPVFCLAYCTTGNAQSPQISLIPAEKFLFNSFVDCNMATVWVGDTFRIFPGKYGEDPLWGEAHELKFASGSSTDEVFKKPSTAFREPVMPPNAPPGTPGLHGAVWFEALYKDARDSTGRTLYALYHNENYPSTLPYNAATGEGYLDVKWPQGLKGAETKTAVCRIGIMKSTDGGHSWQNKGIILQDYQNRMILRPHNTAINFAGGVGDPSAVANGDYLYIFFGEYGYPHSYDSATYNPVEEWKAQCISIARIALKDLDDPINKAKRWDGRNFSTSGDSAGVAVSALQIPVEEGGGPASSPTAKYYWGPSVSWNDYLQCWVMLMAKAEGPSWKGSSIYASFNTHADLGQGNNSQEWSKPQQLINKPGHTVWYPSLQPLNTPTDIARKYTSLNPGQRARLFYKDMWDKESPYLSEYVVEFIK